MAGKCPVGLAIEEILGVMRWARPNPTDVTLQGRGWPAVGMLLISACLPTVRRCELARIPESFEMLVRAGYACVDLSYLIPGVLRHTDIPLIIQRNRRTEYALTDPLRFAAP